jgi:cytochrome c-type biogenesis protein CcmE
MRRQRKFLLGGAVIALALAYMIYAGVTQSMVYFVTPSELSAAPVSGKAYRLGGMVAPGSVVWQPRTLELTFAVTDGKATVPVRHRGTPPDLFGEGRGAVVEGNWASEGYFSATLIMAKHSEEYEAPHDASDAGYKELLRTLRKDEPR